jgi:hypothetical protein
VEARAGKLRRRVEGHDGSASSSRLPSGHICGFPVYMAHQCLTLGRRGGTGHARESLCRVGDGNLPLYVRPLDASGLKDYALELQFIIENPMLMTLEPEPPDHGF